MPEKPTYRELEKKVRKLEKALLEHKREQGLVRRTNMFQGILNAMEESAFLTDTQGRVFYANTT